MIILTILAPDHLCLTTSNLTMAEAADITTQRKVKKSVTFNNEDTIEQYSSPYCDPSFMSTESPSGRSINKRRHVYLNQRERTIVQMFYNNFELSFDPATSVTSEQVYNWFNSELERRGEKKWSKQGKKWTYVANKLNLDMSLWKRRIVT